MKAVILAGGLGARLREETEYKPKPMVEIGGRPILWHIMKMYAGHGFKDFVICLGYKGEVIKEYFYHYQLHHSDATITLGTRDIEFHTPNDERGWRVTLADTGEATLTGGRVKRIARYLHDKSFMVTYGDGVSDVDITALAAHHRSHGKLATVTAVHPSSRFGQLAVENGLVRLFREKPQVEDGWINGGFFVFEREVLDLIGGDEESLEQGLLGKLAELNQLAVYAHSGFWQCMDTYREMQLLNHMWHEKKAPWATWC